jgi:sugar (pentulose or hexulose) kinase
MDGAWLVDREGRPVRPGILWNDGPKVDWLTRWRDDRTLAEIFRVSGNGPNPGFQIPVLCWLAENEPETLDRAHRNLFARDSITYCLTEELATNHSDGSHTDRRRSAAIRNCLLYGGPRAEYGTDPMGSV